MKTPVTDIKTFTLSITREFNAPREKVFQAWTDPVWLTKWFGPTEVATTAAQVDLKIGGKYQFTMKKPDGNLIHQGGEYLEIDPPQKLVFTWVLEGQSCKGSEGLFAETRVTVEFQDMGSSTRLVLTHEFLPSEESKQGHSMGWIGSLDCLNAFLA